ncbi:MAG: glycosyltransferase family 39 protein [Dehalococcoidia bacterium]|nr:glycosyltransferase family 39 protein [Dehalococcoidia bacterium]MCB9486946.1 glycosyltransferase family 39 protein [Thermoflexaceae bacterium]
MIPRIRTLRPYVGLAAILGVAGALRCYRLGDAGQNLYYAAGVRSMLDSWHNFFYVAVEPGGTIMVDKPPLGLWLEAAAATLFGFHYWVLAVPQVVAGLVAVLVTFFVARSAYGVRVGLLAAAVLAVMPMSVVSARNNSFDTVTMLLTLLAASALLHGLSKQRLRWLAVSALLLGLGFNTKMSEAFLPLPAFAACYVLTCRAGRRQQILGAGLFCSILVVVSLSWVTAVGLTPAQSRPVVYNGRGNSIWALTFEYNGLNRIIGQRPQPHLRGDAAPAGISNPELNAAAHTPAPGPQRLLSGKLGTQIGWFLPLSLLGLVFAWRRRSATWHPREHDLLWGTWFVTGFLYFSVAAFALPQYLEAMAAPTAILAALGVSELPGLMCQRRNWTLSGIVGLAIYAGWLMAPAANSLAFAYAALAFAILALVAVALGRLRRAPAAALRAAGAIAALFVIFVGPFAWSIATVASPPTGSATRYPVAGPRSYRDYPAAPGGDQPGSASQRDPVLAYLESRSRRLPGGFLVATERSLYGNAARYVLTTNRPVLTFDVFGGDGNLAAATLSRLVTEGNLRFLELPVEGPWTDPGTSLGHWFLGTCIDITTPALIPVGGETHLYDCAGASVAGTSS